MTKSSRYSCGELFYVELYLELLSCYISVVLRLSYHIVSVVMKFD